MCQRYCTFLLFGSMLFLPFVSHAAGDAEQILNVKQWKGYLDIRVTETLHTQRSWKAGHEERKLNSQRDFRFNLLTGNGVVSLVDPFDVDKKQKPKQAETGGAFAGKDMKKMQRAMERSGIDPNMMGKIMEEMNKMKGLNIAANKYKQWTETTFQTNTTGNWRLTDITRGKATDTSGKLCSYSREQNINGVYEATGGLMLVVNLQKNSYSFKWSISEKKPQKATEHFTSKDSCEGNSSKTREITYKKLTANQMKTVLSEPLPDSGLILAGSKVYREKQDNGKELTVHLQWTFLPSDMEVPKSWVEYNKGGDDWVPEDDNKVTALLKWEKNIVPSKVRFTLYDISEEPGINLNSKDKNTAPDLEFDEENKARGFEVTQSGKSYIAIKEKLSGRSESIVLHAKDFGAYGKLKAEINVNGHWFDATARPFELSYLPVPYDKNNNLIADKWEKDVAVFGKNLSPNWDEDPYPQDQKSNGDGFTLYEEYRGFQETGHVFRKADNEQVKDGHVRMDPMYKDVFIYDRDGLFVKYYKPYNPADLNWHMIDLTMIKTKGNLGQNANFRWVNFNTSKKHFIRNQYAIFILNKGVSSNTELKNDVGYTPVLPSCSNTMRYTHPLKCIFSAEIYLNTINAWASNAPGTNTEQNKYALDQLTTTIIHELGHALGIDHHKPKGDYGVKKCSIRYDSDTEMGHPRLFGFLRTQYCRKGENYLTGEANASGKFKQFPSHNCYGQINIKGN